MKDVLPKKAEWLKDRAICFKPNENKVCTEKGDTIEYDIMIIAIGLELYWNKVNRLKYNYLHHYFLHVDNELI
jgi:NADH dehydrogenase FAD-containing subunit